MIQMETCEQLQKLQHRLREELRILKETRSEMEAEGFENPLETVNVIKSLQGTLNIVEQELTKCPVHPVHP